MTKSQPERILEHGHRLSNLEKRLETTDKSVAAITKVLNDLTKILHQITAKSDETLKLINKMSWKSTC